MREFRSIHAFTLIELLVVVAIITILVGMLLPNLSAAKERSRRTVCANNLRTLGTAMLMYMDENGGSFPRYYVDVNGASGAGRLWWFGFELGGPGSTSNRPLDKAQSPLAPYTAGLDSRMQCPDFPYTDSGYFPKFSQHAASYGYNLAISLYNRQKYADRMDRIFGFADGMQFDSLTHFNEGFYIQYDKNVANPSLGLDGYAHFRHGKQAQMVMLDGHLDMQNLAGVNFRTVAGAPTGNLAGTNGGTDIYGLGP